MRWLTAAGHGIDRHAPESHLDQLLGSVATESVLAQ